MIVETILNFLVGIVLGIIKLFPTIPKMNLDFLNWIIRMFSLVDLFVSLRVLSTCLVVIFVVMNARLIWSVIMWVVRKIPFLK